MDRGWAVRWAVLACLALAGCVPTQGTQIQGIYTDQFSTFVEVDGEYRSMHDFGGPWVDWSLTSIIDKQTHAVTYRIDFDYLGPPGSPRFVNAADDTAKPLQLVRFAHRRNCDAKPCSIEDEAGVVLDTDTLLGRLTTGYQVKVSARDGEAYVLTITPDMIAKQLTAVNQVLAQLGPASATAMTAPPPPPPAANPAPVTPPPPAFVRREPGFYASSDLVTMPDSKTKGIKVTGVEPGSIADLAGLRVGDIIVACDGVPLKSVQDLQKKLGAITGHGSVTVLVIHPETGLQSSVVLGR